MSRTGTSSGGREHAWNLCVGAAENLAVNKGYANPAVQAVQGWRKSPGHHANLIGNFNLTGVGITRSADGTYYFTQIYLLVR